MADGLNDRQTAFVNAYLANGFNATRAAIEAGYSEKTARQQAVRLLTNVYIAAAVKQGLTEYAMPAQEVLARLADQARSTMEDFLDESGDIDLKKAREQGRLHLIKAKSKTTTLYGGSERIELYSAQSALEILAKHHALLTENVNLSGEVNVKGYANVSPDQWDTPEEDQAD